MKNRIAEHLPKPWWRTVFSSNSAGEGKSSLQVWLDPVEEAIAKYPAASLGAAFVVGVTFAWWLKRR